MEYYHRLCVPGWLLWHHPYGVLSLTVCAWMITMTSSIWSTITDCVCLDDYYDIIHMEYYHWLCVPGWLLWHHPYGLLSLTVCAWMITMTSSIWSTITDCVCLDDYYDIIHMEYYHWLCVPGWLLWHHPYRVLSLTVFAWMIAGWCACSLHVECTNVLNIPCAWMMCM